MGTNTIIVSPESGKRVKAIREALGLTQVELANEYKCGQSTIFRYENGVREPSGAFIKFLHDKYRVSLEYYTTGKGPKFETGKKTSGPTDVISLKNTIELQEGRINELERKVNGLIREVYVLKHGVKE
ncbi:helix-turn-helix transcriptional regulator [Mucilaginibacter sp. KACC 22773]|uniref:helix-turn-helix domain-containing protein n=1 Tax=Mucilaginibacter sp. KACC 22773 TaxID=3025671 RepID=UPI0023653FC7|nr:helix-turn-helix transcriptional regulator [Mucilaginibacter sp. KACC 22773]WDF79538.1 helix-turn-helix transcriptional regulator [Mucilaginibacter sp. KACC 22773]